MPILLIRCVCILLMIIEDTKLEDNFGCGVIRGILGVPGSFMRSVCILPESVCILPDDA